MKRFEQAGPDYPLHHHVVPPRLYLAVFAALLALTSLTVWVAYRHLGDPWNDVVALTVAFTKATLVVLFFMHVKWGSPMIKLTVITALLFLAVLLGITWSDYWARTSEAVRVMDIEYQVTE